MGESKSALDLFLTGTADAAGAMVYRKDAQAELAALRAQLAAAEERARDLGLMLRAALRGHLRILATMDAHGHQFVLSYTQLPRLGDDGTGIPLLTPEARAALTRAQEQNNG